MGIISQCQRESPVFPNSTIHKPHGYDKSHGSQYSDWWEILHRIQTIILQDRKCRCICQCNGRHKESHTQRIKRNKQGLIFQFLSETSLITQPPAA